MNEDLPSINDFIEDRSNLPTLNESVESDLPSYKDFIEETGDDIVVNMDGGVGGSWKEVEYIEVNGQRLDVQQKLPQSEQEPFIPDFHD